MPNSPMFRLADSISSMAVCMAQLLGMHEGIDLRCVDKRWHCDKASPIVWFDSVLMSMCAKPTLLNPWLFDGDRIKLIAANGLWIWVTTGRYEHRPRIDSEPSTYYEARWPD